VSDPVTDAIAHLTAIHGAPETDRATASAVHILLMAYMRQQLLLQPMPFNRRDHASSYSENVYGHMQRGWNAYGQRLAAKAVDHPFTSPTKETP
jgi:hypothetical protein